MSKKQLTVKQVRKCRRNANAFMAANKTSRLDEDILLTIALNALLDKPAKPSYISDLRVDLSKEEYRWKYISACAMDSGEALRVGLKDIEAQIKTSAQLEEAEAIAQHADRYLSRDATTMELFLFMDERLAILRSGTVPAERQPLPKEIK